MKYRVYFFYMLQIVLYILIISGCSLIPAAQGLPVLDNMSDGGEEEKMADNQGYHRESLPQIDQSVPERLETATFALG